MKRFTAIILAFLLTATTVSAAGWPDWAESARAWAEGRGLIQGDENGALRYKMFVTREELAVLLQRAAGADGKNR